MDNNSTGYVVSMDRTDEDYITGVPVYCKMVVDKVDRYSDHSIVTCKGYGFAEKVLSEFEFKTVNPPKVGTIFKMKFEWPKEEGDE